MPGIGLYYTVAQGINNAGQVVGFYFNPSGEYGFVDTNGTYATVSVPGARSTVINGINNVGQLVGDYADANGIHGFVDTNGVFATFSMPGALDTFATGINDAGQVTVDAYNGGYIYSNGVFTAFNVPGASYTGVNGINNSGQVVGFYQGVGGNHGFIATPTAVSEPASAVLLCMGLAGLGFASRRRRARA